MNPALNLKPGARLGSFILGRELGRGGSAVVFSAAPEDPSQEGSSRGPVAIKVQHLDQPEARKRFVREFETLRELRIPGVAVVYEAGEHDNLLWFSMQRVDGLDFREKLQKMTDIRARVLAAAQLGSQLCQVLMDIHRHGYIHRDIKPGNVLIDARNELKVLDFGVVQGTAVGTPITLPGSVLGTFPFMAPEQIAGLRLTPKLDVFAAGLLIYEGIVGPRPSPAKPHEWLSVQCLERPTPLACLDKRIPRRISAAIDAMLAFHPCDRPTAEEARDLLVGALRMEGSEEWPHPPKFAEAGQLLQQLVIQAEGKGPRIAFIHGPAGSGRRRISEQLQRRAILRGIRSLKAQARLDQPGGAAGNWLSQLLGRAPNREWRDEICGEDGPLLAVMWPDLPVVWALPEERPNVKQVAEAAARVLSRAAAKEPLLLVVEDFDQTDSLTSRTVEALAQIGGKKLMVLCLRDERWENERCGRVVDRLVASQQATDFHPPVLDPVQADRVVQSLMPGQIVATPGSGSAQRVVEHGLHALARWRGETIPNLPREAWILGLSECALPAGVLRLLGLDPEQLLANGIIRGTSRQGHLLATKALRAQCRSFLENRVQEEDRLASAIASAWVQDPRAHGAQARHLLNSSHPERALVPAIDATLHSLESGRMKEARRWLLVIDQIPRDPSNEAYQVRRFDLAIARAKVGMATQPRAPRADLVGQARRRARTPVQQARARLLEATLEARYGTGELAIAQLNALVNNVASQHPEVAIAALAEQGDLFLQTGSHVRARAAVVRAEELRGARRPDVIQSRLDRIRADALAAAGAIEEAVQRCNAALALAEELDLERPQARIKLRLASLRLQMCQLDEASELAWQARAQHHGDRRLSFAVETTLVLAEIALLSSNLTACRRLLAQANAALSDRPASMLRFHWQRIRLALAATRGDVDAVRNALAEAAAMDLDDPWWKLTEARWWLASTQLDRARAIIESLRQIKPCPPILQIEIGRTLAELHLQSGRLQEALDQAILTRDSAQRERLENHVLWMDLLIQALEPRRDRSWSVNLKKARQCRWSNLQLWAMELDAIRSRHLQDPNHERIAWERLIETAQLLGYQSLRRRAIAELRALNIQESETGPDSSTLT